MAFAFPHERSVVRVRFNDHRSKTLRSLSHIRTPGPLRLTLICDDNFAPVLQQKRLPKPVSKTHVCPQDASFPIPHHMFQSTLATCHNSIAAPGHLFHNRPSSRPSPWEAQPPAGACSPRPSCRPHLQRQKPPNIARCQPTRKETKAPPLRQGSDLPGGGFTEGNAKSADR